MMRKLSSAYAMAIAALGAAAISSGIGLAVTLAQSQSYPINDDTDDPAVWGKIFPLYYELYLRTTDMQRTRHGGSEAEPRTPTKADPRSVIAKSKVEEDAGLRAMWQGYAFAIDFREDRGHAHMLEDQTYTKRTSVVAQPGACMNCHASTYVAYKQAGNGDITKGFETDQPDALHRRDQAGEAPGCRASTAMTRKRWRCASPGRHSSRA